MAVLIQHPRAVRDTHQGARRIEDVNQQQRQDHADHGQVQGRADIQREKARQAGWPGHHALEFGHAGQPAQYGDEQYADNDRAGDAPGAQGGNQHKSEQQEYGGGLRKIAQAHQGDVIVDDNAAPRERNNAQEETDAGTDAALQRAGNGIDQPPSYGQHGQRDKNQAGNKHRAQGALPTVAETQHDAIGKKRILAHARGLRDRVVCVQPHERRAQGRREAGGHEHGAEIHAGGGENPGIDHRDVGHGQERGHAGRYFPANAAVVRRDPEKAIDPRWHGVGHRIRVALRSGR